MATNLSYLHSALINQSNHAAKVIFSTPKDEDLNALLAIGAPAVPYLAQALVKQDSILKNSYLKFYAGTPAHLQKWLPLPAVDAVFMHSAALAALSRMGNLAKPAYPALLVAATDKNDYIRYQASQLLIDLGKHDPEIHAALDRLLKPGLSLTETFALVGQYKLDGSNAIQAMLLALKDINVTNRVWALSYLNQMRAKAEAATPQVLSLLQDSNPSVRANACHTLGKINGKAAVVVPALVQVLGDPENYVRRCAAETLGLYGSAAQMAVPKLIYLVETEQGVNRFCIGEALKQIDAAAAANAGIR